MCYIGCRMFSRNITAPEALRYYADKRRKLIHGVQHDLEWARINYYGYRETYGSYAAKQAQKCITLLEFLLNHVELLPTDAATIEVLWNDLADMKRAADTAQMYLANPSVSFPK